MHDRFLKKKHKWWLSYKKISNNIIIKSLQIKIKEWESNLQIITKEKKRLPWKSIHKMRKIKWAIEKGLKWTKIFLWVYWLKFSMKRGTWVTPLVEPLTPISGPWDAAACGVLCLALSRDPAWGSLSLCPTCLFVLFLK